MSLVQEKAVRRSDAMVMAEDPDDLVIVGEQQDRELAKQLEYFRDQLQGESTYTGIYDLLVLALMRRMRVFMWWGLERKYITEEHAP